MKTSHNPALFLLSFVVLCAASACSSGEEYCQECQDAGAANADHLNLVVDFKLNPGQTALTGLYVYGRYFLSGHDTEAERKPFKCQTFQVQDATRLTCSVGDLPFSQEVRFMVNVPQPDGSVVPACKALDDCIGQFLVTSPDQPAFHGDASNLTLVQDPLFVGGVAIKMYVPRPNL